MLERDDWWRSSHDLARPRSAPSWPEREIGPERSEFPHTYVRWLPLRSPIYTPSSFKSSYLGLVLQRHRTFSEGECTCRSYCTRVTSGEPAVCHSRGPRTGVCLCSFSAKITLIFPVVHLLSES